MGSLMHWRHRRTRLQFCLECNGKPCSAPLLQGRSFASHDTRNRIIKACSRRWLSRQNDSGDPKFWRDKAGIQNIRRHRYNIRRHRYKIHHKLLTEYMSDTWNVHDTPSAEQQMHFQVSRAWLPDSGLGTPGPDIRIRRMQLQFGVRSSNWFWIRRKHFKSRLTVPDDSFCSSNEIDILSYRYLFPHWLWKVERDL